jgi:hypothetical protein
MTAPGILSAEWALSAFDVSPDDFWSDGGERLVDGGELARFAACAHAEADFELLWERCDATQDVMAILGCMIATTRLDRGFDHPLDRSWFHGLFVDLARLEGALDLELASERMLLHAVGCYWGAMKSFIAAVKEQLDIVAAELGEGDEAREEEAVENAARQLSLF